MQGDRGNEKIIKNHQGVKIWWRLSFMDVVDRRLRVMLSSEGKTGISK